MDRDKIARMIAFWHGQKITFIHPRDGALTIAAQHGYGGYGDAPDRYSRDHWQEYTSAAAAMIELFKEPDYVG